MRDVPILYIYIYSKACWETYPYQAPPPSLPSLPRPPSGKGDQSAANELGDGLIHPQPRAEDFPAAPWRDEWDEKEEEKPRGPLIYMGIYG
jgi:hypothetical protein